MLRNLSTNVTNARANVNLAEFTSRATNARDVTPGHRIRARSLTTDKRYKLVG